MTDRWYRRAGWASLWFTVVVILGGAVVRASGSGDGCGESWPRCEGSLIPLGGDTETMIEFAHRAFTGVLAVALIAFATWTIRHVPRGRPVRRWLFWAAVFFLGEVIIGAVLVLFGWVDTDESIGRVIAVPIHLVNTFLLLGALAGAAFHASRSGTRVRWPDRATRSLSLAALGIVLVVGALGALNALSDTLYPDSSLGSGFSADFDSASPLLTQLRIFHPAVAIIGGLALVWIVRHPAYDPEGRAIAMRNGVVGIVFLQFAVGIVNIALLTPIEVQVLHLLVADVLWILLVLGALTVSRTFVDSDAPEPVR
jgi:heme A synthase